MEHFGVLEKRIYVNTQFKANVQDIKNSIYDNGMLAILGAPGAGKTLMFKHAARALRLNADDAPIFIHVRNKYKEKLTISSILNAIVFDISSEMPRHDLEARSRQVIRLMGKRHVEHKRNLCVVIEEAHRLHSNTLRAIKELREDAFAGISPLFSVILLGHEELGAKLESRREVFWRTEILSLNQSSGWMVYNDRIDYLKAVYGGAINSNTRHRIATLYRVPLEMDFFVEQKMSEAQRAGMKQLSEDCFEASPREMKEALDVSLKQIADEAGIGKTTVHDVIAGRNDYKSEAVKGALQRLAEKKHNEDVKKVA